MTGGICLDSAAAMAGDYPDSTHPKTPDSWVLYTREFYQLIREPGRGRRLCAMGADARP